MKLTATEVAALGTGEHPLGDGLWLRVRSSGARSWAVRYSRSGRDVRFTIGPAVGTKALTLKAARERAREILVAVAAGRDPQAEKVAERRAPKTKALTVEQLVREAVERIPLKARTRRNYERTAARRIYPKIGSIPADELRGSMIRRWSDAIARKRPTMANSAFDIVSRAYLYGRERGLVEASPFPGLKRPAPERRRERVLSPVELWALERALSRRSKRWPNAVGPVIVRLLLLTGVRKHMVLGMSRSELDLESLDGPTWTIPAERMKAKRPHVVPLVPAAVEMIRERLALTRGEHLFPAGVFPGQNQGPGRGSVTLDNRYVAGLRRRINAELVAAGQKPAEHWIIHDIRRTFATLAREKGGIGLDVISLILSHSPREGPRVTYTYMRAPLLKERRAALEWWDGGRAVAVDPRTKVVRMEEAKRG